MNNELQRLLKAAAGAKRDHVEAMDPAIAARVLSQWRIVDGEDLAPLLMLLRRAVLYSALVMMLSLGCIWAAGRSESASQTALANYAMKIQLPP
jgi:hypothetical protein